jgi:oxygen-independent coproporphyrinogen III oxidase
MILEPSTQLLTASPYQSYTYAYPHKTAYRSLEPAMALKDVWANEARDALFLYIHIPFCEMRCGFCNLFTTVNAPQSLERSYLQTLERQALRVLEALGDAKFARFAIGGGTPTYLEPADLERLFVIAQKVYGIDLASTPTSVETSPATASADRLEVLKNYGVDRVSIGVQSFIESEVHSVGRTQQNTQVFEAFKTIRSAGIPILNIDLIYGLAFQTPASWLQSLQTALEWQPEELFLYPLYVRPKTGLGNSKRSWDDARLELYRLGRDFLASNGYEQVSMRMFRRNTAPKNSSSINYDCQNDGMVGLGCGARSYSQNLHYSSEYAVGQTGVREILHDFVQRPDSSFDLASHGFKLDRLEQQRRFVIQSLLQVSGLDLHFYRSRFDSDVFMDLAQLLELMPLGFATLHEDSLKLTAAGLERSDAIGPWLYSSHAQHLMQGYELR